MSEWKYFKKSEFECNCGCRKNLIQDELIDQLDELRDFYGKALIINSGYRCEKHNQKVGGDQFSSHLTGRATDLKAETSKVKYEILAIIFEYSIFQRIGIGKNFIHVDIDKSKPQKIIWTY